MKTTVKQKFDVYGMSCAACAARVERAVKNTDGVESVTVSLLTNEMLVVYSLPATPEIIIENVKKSGYNAVIAQIDKTKRIKKLPPEVSAMIRRLVWSAFFLAALMYLAMGAMIGIPIPAYLLSEKGLFVSAILQSALSLIVLVINRKFFISGVRSFIRLSPNMDSLVALGSGASFLYSLVVTVLIVVRTAKGDFAGVHALAHDLYFEGAAMIVTLITVGKLLESLSKGKTTNAINALMSLAPETATILIDGKEKVVPVENIEPGDLIIVKTGDHVPVDAIITDGSGFFDTSSMTGEPIPAECVIGSEIFCGTTLTNGHVVARATKVGKDTSLGKITELVRSVNLSKAPIAKIADRVSGVFVPSVIILALITLAIWMFAGESLTFSLQKCVAVLLISCPCALGLATPVAIMVASGVGARCGTLFKSATALENLGKTTAVVFDKTGTITIGEPTVTDVLPAKAHTESELFAVAASLEVKSEHPLAKAVVKGYTGAFLPVENYAAVTGQGLIGKTGGETIFGGNKNMMTQHGIDVSEHDAICEKLSKQGKTPLYFAKGKSFLGVIAIADKEKPEAKQVIAELKRMGITPFMLTGDNRATALAVCKRVGIDEENVFAEKLPDGKANVISELKKTHRVAMVGDGVNDAPSLTFADVGITLENGSFVAADASEVMILGSLYNLVSAIALSKKVILNVKENLFWAFFYNVVCVPIAAGAFYRPLGWSLSPMIAAAAMSLSSLFVVSNALRLNLFKPYKPCGRTCEAATQTVGNNDDDNNIEKENKDMGLFKKTFTVKGMMCAHCEARVKAAIEKIPGVTKCKPDHKKDRVEIIYDTEIDESTVRSAIENEGYSVQ